MTDAQRRTLNMLVLVAIVVGSRSARGSGA
jgi:hypothetical protein